MRLSSVLIYFAFGLAVTLGIICGLQGALFLIVGVWLYRESFKKGGKLANDGGGYTLAKFILGSLVFYVACILFFIVTYDQAFMRLLNVGPDSAARFAMRAILAGMLGGSGIIVSIHFAHFVRLGHKFEH